MKSQLIIFCLILNVCTIALVLSESCRQEEDSIRLFQTSTINSLDGNVGRLELCWNGEWGTVTLKSTLNFWTEKNVQVACRQLGFSGGLNSIPPVNISLADKSPINLSIHFGDIACNGSEQALTECRASRYRDTTTPNDHHKDVFIVCRPNATDYSELHVAGGQVGDIRLFGHTTNGRGAVEILTTQGWSGICPDSSWGGTDARIICQSLGYDFGFEETLEVPNSLVNRSIYDAQCMDDISGTATRDSPARVLAKKCSFRAIASPGNCLSPQNMFAGVNCGNSMNSNVRSIRLFGDGIIDSEREVGVLEVFVDSRWGVVCASQSESTNELNARILCETFKGKNGGAKPVRLSLSSLRTYESNLKPLWFNGLSCPSNVTDISGCTFREPLGFGNCHSRPILALDCGVSGNPRGAGNHAVIAGVIVVVVVFILVLLFVVTVLYKVFKRRRMGVVTSYGGLNAMMVENELPLDNTSPVVPAAAVSESAKDDAKLADEDAKLSDEVDAHKNGNCNS